MTKVCCFNQDNVPPIISAPVSKNEGSWPAAPEQILHPVGSG